MAKRKTNAALQIILKEVLEQTPDKLANALAEAYRDGKVISVAMALASRGIGFKTALQWEIGEDARLKATKGTA